MSAQYRPYRDEEDVPPEERAWVDDGPSGRIQIYEKTTHDIHHVVTQRHLVLGGCTIAVVAGLIGLCIGYFGHTEHSTCVRGRSVALFSVYDEDPHVKEKILQLVDAKRFAHYADLFSTLSDDTAALNVVHSEWENVKLDEINFDSFVDSVAHQGHVPNTLEIIYPNGTRTETKLIMSQDQYAFVAFTVNKTIEGKLAYASKLDRKDFIFLDTKKTAKGSILLVRYGTIPLREQIENAYSLGALGVLLYMDPLDYGIEYNRSAIPRVSAPNLGQHHNINIHEHDFPYEALPELSSHLSFYDLPIQTISGNLARQLLRQLMVDVKGTGSAVQVPARMRGEFNDVEYVSGTSNFTVRLATHNKITAENQTNVVGMIRGRVEPDRYVIVGCDRNRWSPSNIGGMAIQQELVRVFTQLVADGWRPRRSIVFISFAGGSMNSVGLEHFLKTRMNVLRDRSVAYIDLSNPVLGTASIIATGSPLLSQAIFNATTLVSSANSHADDKSLSLYREWLQHFDALQSLKSAQDLLKAAQNVTKRNNSAEVKDIFLLEPNDFSPNGSHGLFDNYLTAALHNHRPLIRMLDYTDSFSPFLTEAGIPVVQLSYVNLDYVQNRRMDPRPWWFRTQFDSLKQASSDPDFRHHLAITKVVAELVRDLTDSLFLPFNLLEYAVTLQTFTDSAQQHFTTVYKDADLHIFDELQLVIKDFAKAAAAFHHRQDLLDLRDPMAIRMVNDQLLLFERALLRSCPDQCLSLTKDEHSRKSHAVVTPLKTYPQIGNIFPSVLDLMASWLSDSVEYDDKIEKRMDLLVHDIKETIRTATASLRDVKTV